MSENIDMFDDFSADDSNRITTREIVMLLRMQNKQLADLNTKIHQQAIDHKEFRNEIHALVESKGKEVTWVSAQIATFRAMMAAFGAVAIILASVFGYFIRVTMEQISVDHDRLIALETRVMQHLQATENEKISVNSR